MTEGEFEKLEATCSDQNTAQYSTGKYVWACGKIFEGSFKCGKMSYGTLTNVSKVNLTNNFFLLRSWSNNMKRAGDTKDHSKMINSMDLESSPGLRITTMKESSLMVR